MTLISFSEGKVVFKKHKVGTGEDCCNLPTCCMCSTYFADYGLTVDVDLVFTIPGNLDCSGEYQLNATLEYSTGITFFAHDAGGYFWPVDLANGNTGQLHFAISCESGKYKLLCVYYNYFAQLAGNDACPDLMTVGFQMSDNPDGAAILEQGLNDEDQCVYFSQSGVLENFANGCTVEYTLTVT